MTTTELRILLAPGSRDEASRFCIQALVGAIVARYRRIK